jgi:hypothetical protein
VTGPVVTVIRVERVDASVSPVMLEVGRRLNEDFENGRHYYAMQGKSF